MQTPRGKAESGSPSVTFALTVTAAFLALMAGLLIAVRLVDPPDHASRGQDASDTQLGHVHGLGVDPADGTLYVASHLGVFRLAKIGAPPERVADRWQDTMGFTVVAPGHFLASGHPDLTEDLPIHLGLIESTDAAATWKSLSLSGKADFHAIDAVRGRTWGFDSQSESLLTSTDNRSWQTVSTDPIADLAIDPSDAARVVATSPKGHLRAYDSTGEVSELASPPLAVVDWPRPSLLVGVSIDGRVYRSEDGGNTWLGSSASTPGQVEALEVGESGWFVATDRGIFTSTDDGRSWQTFLPQQ